MGVFNEKRCKTAPLMKKNRNVENYEQLEKNVENAIDKVKPENYNIYSFDKLSFIFFHKNEHFYIF